MTTSASVNDQPDDAARSVEPANVSAISDDDRAVLLAMLPGEANALVENLVRAMDARLTAAEASLRTSRDEYKRLRETHLQDVQAEVQRARREWSARDRAAVTNDPTQAQQQAHPPSASPQSAPEGNPAEPGIYPAWISDDEGAHCDCAMWDGEFWRVWCDAFDPPEWDQIENLNSRVIRWTTPDRSLAPPQADANAIPLRAAPCAPPEGKHAHSEWIESAYREGWCDAAAATAKARDNYALDLDWQSSFAKTCAESHLPYLARPTQAAKAIAGDARPPAPPAGKGKA